MIYSTNNFHSFKLDSFRSCRPLKLQLPLKLSPKLLTKQEPPSRPNVKDPTTATRDKALGIHHASLAVVITRSLVRMRKRDKTRLLDATNGFARLREKALQETKPQTRVTS